MTGRVIPFDAAAHKVADALLPWFVNGTLEGDELAFVQRHLGECPRCQNEVEWLRELHAACIAGEAMPGASATFRNLRRQLEEPREGRDSIARLRRSRGRARLWSRWAIAAQLVVIAVLGTLLLSGTDGPALYRTLGARNATVPATGSLVVVFDPATTEAEVHRILRGAGARIVDGPTQANAYVLEVPPGQTHRAAQAIKSERAALLVEPFGPQGAR
jgi:anti-sigma factor RsiW